MKLIIENWRQFINEVKSLEFNQSLKNSLYTKKNEYIFLLEEIDQILNVLKKKTSDQSLSLRSHLKVSEKKIKKDLFIMNQTLDSVESGNSLFKIVRIKKINDIKNFNIKFSIYLTSYLIIFISIIIYIFRKKKLGFYR